MARFEAVSAVCEGVVRLLRAAAQAGPDILDDAVFRSVVAKEPPEDPPNKGVTLCLYRVKPSGDRRAPAGRVLPNGNRQRPRIGIELHLLLTVWAETADMQNQVAGWMVRVLDDHSLLDPDFLNGYRPRGPVLFQPEERVTLGMAELTNYDLFHVWEHLKLGGYRLSIPYIARSVDLESFEEVVQGVPVQERVFEYGVPDRG